MIPAFFHIENTRELDLDLHMSPHEIFGGVPESRMMIEGEKEDRPGTCTRESKVKISPPPLPFRVLPCLVESFQWQLMYQAPSPISSSISRLSLREEEDRRLDNN